MSGERKRERGKEREDERGSETEPYSTLTKGKKRKLHDPWLRSPGQPGTRKMTVGPGTPGEVLPQGEGTKAWLLFFSHS